MPNAMRIALRIALRSVMHGQYEQYELTLTRMRYAACLSVQPPFEISGSQVTRARKAQR